MICGVLTRCEVVQSVHHGINRCVDPAVASPGLRVLCEVDLLVELTGLQQARVLFTKEVTGDLALVWLGMVLPQGFR